MQHLYKEGALYFSLKSSLVANSSKVSIYWRIVLLQEISACLFSQSAIKQSYITHCQMTSDSIEYLESLAWQIFIPIPRTTAVYHKDHWDHLIAVIAKLSLRLDNANRAVV